MGLLDAFRKKNEEPSAAAEESKRVLDSMVQLVWGYLKDERGVRVEDAISLAATIVGERVIDAAGNFDMRAHDFPPGHRVFSDIVNTLLIGDVDASGDKPIVPTPDSVIGTLYGIPEFPADSHPPLRQVFESFASRLHEDGGWGKAPLSVPQGHLPFRLPLQVGFETRKPIDGMLPAHYSKKEALFAATSTLVYVLRATRQHLDPKIAMALAVETVHGMSKTAPMTEKAFAEMQKQ